MRSMTGFGRGVDQSEWWSFTVSVRCVNHRFLDFSLRCREAFRPWENELRRAAEEELSRGRIEVTVDAERRSGSEGAMALDDDVLGRLEELLDTLEDRRGRPVTVTLGDVFRVPGLVAQETAREEEVDDADRKALLAAFVKAVDGVLRMRREEGQAIQASLGKALEQLEAALTAIESRREEWVEELSSRLEAKLQRLLEDRGVVVESSRYVQEAALLTERSDITEELERWAGHLAAVRRTVEEPGPHGKKLDFLAQEILREINTVGSKARDLTIAERVVEAKLASEALREQIQNVE